MWELESNELCLGDFQLFPMTLFLVRVSLIPDFYRSSKLDMYIFKFIARIKSCVRKILRSILLPYRTIHGVSPRTVSFFRKLNFPRKNAILLLSTIAISITHFRAFHFSLLFAIESERPFLSTFSHVMGLPFDLLVWREDNIHCFIVFPMNVSAFSSGRPSKYASIKELSFDATTHVTGDVDIYF